MHFSIPHDRLRFDLRRRASVRVQCSARSPDERLPHILLHGFGSRLGVLSERRFGQRVHELPHGMQRRRQHKQRGAQPHQPFRAAVR